MNSERMTEAWYVDSSALVKLIVSEAESEALALWLRDERVELVSSVISRTEVMRAARLAGPDAMERATTLLRSISYTRVDRETCERAASLDPAELRTLDALHVASALLVGPTLAGVVTYDHRMTTAVTAAGLWVAAPS